jgi:TatD DNase family protein
MYVDSHAHIEMDAFDVDRGDVIERARQAGIDTIVCVGNGDVSRDSHDDAFRLADQYPFVYTTVGVHPHQAILLDHELAGRLTQMSEHPKVIAWGEIGLDYHYDHSPREVQRSAFRQQLRLAASRGMPVVIHTREAEQDTLTILQDEWTGCGIPGIIHCFTGTRRFAEQVIELGFSISFSGVVTFKNSQDLRDTARILPKDRLLVETDSPFLAPAPFRGRRNEPSFVVETARCLASLRDLAIEEVGRITSSNFRHLFGMAE